MQEAVNLTNQHARAEDESDVLSTSDESDVLPTANPMFCPQRIRMPNAYLRKMDTLLRATISSKLYEVALWNLDERASSMDVLRLHIL